MTDPYGRKSDRKNKVRKQNSSGELYYSPLGF